MALQVTGRIHTIGNAVSIPSKNGSQPYAKRELVLDTTRFDPYTGERDKFENFPAFEFGGEKCKELDGFRVGQVVTVSFDLQGSFYKDMQGLEKNFTRIRAYKIEARQVANQPKTTENQPKTTTQQVPPPPPPPPAQGNPYDVGQLPW